MDLSATEKGRETAPQRRRAVKKLCDIAHSERVEMIRQVIVDGACGIVTQGIKRLHDEGHELEAGEKSKLMINLLTVMVGEQAAAPVIDVGVGA